MKSTILFWSDEKLTCRIWEQMSGEVYTCVDVHLNLFVESQTWSIAKTNMF